MMPRLIVWPCAVCLDTVTGYADRRLLAHLRAARELCREPRYVDARSLTPPCQAPTPGSPNTTRRPDA